MHLHVNAYCVATYCVASLGSRPSPYVRVLIARGWANQSSGKLPRASICPPTPAPGTEASVLPHTAYPMSVHGVQVLCMVCRFCAWCAGSVHGVQVLYIVCMSCAWCGRSVHGVHVQSMVCTFCAWCGRSVHGVHVLYMDAVSPLALVRHVSNHSSYTCTCT